MLVRVTEPYFRRNTVFLVVIALIAALVVRSLIRVELRRRGIDDTVAGDVSYLAVPPLILLLTLPIWNDARNYIGQLYRRSDLSLRIIVFAIATGVLLRVAWWASTVARVSFGWFTEPGVSASVGPVFSWQCPPPLLLTLGILVMALLVPLIEEIVHRGYIFNTTIGSGPVAAIVVSSTTFMVFHKAGGWITVFAVGVVFAMLFHRTGSLWMSTISHSTYNLIGQLDWRCLQGKWRVSDQDIPLVTSGVMSLLVLVSATAVIALLVQRTPGTRLCPGRGCFKTSLRRVQ